MAVLFCIIFVNDLPNVLENNFEFYTEDEDCKIGTQYNQLLHYKMT